ncbi:MAG: Stp1/IreP family PP2C-type Ser/Thr phosphatase [Thermodesulfovibrionales bacterium]
MTDVGKQRQTNEDRVLVDVEHGIFLVADGMGGHNAGEIASSIAVQEAYAFLVSAPRESASQDLLPLLEEAFRQAHASIRRKASSDSALDGMGTTLVGVLIDGDMAFVCNSGDSRAYLFRKRLIQLTVDHSLENQRNILTQALGTTQDPVPFRQSAALQPGDVLLLCTDGLTGLLDDSELETILRAQGNSPDRAVHALVGEALRRGGHDNVSAVVVQY